MSEVSVPYMIADVPAADPGGWNPMLLRVADLES